MTGYGLGQAGANQSTVSAEVSAVNARHCEITVKLPTGVAYLEPEIRKQIQQKVSRGRITAFIMPRANGGSPFRLRVDREAAKEYCKLARSLSDELGLFGEVTLDLILSLPGIWQQPPEEEQNRAMAAEMLQALATALDAFDLSRRQEGKVLEDELRSRIAAMESLLHRVEERAPELLGNYMQRLKERVRAIGNETSYRDERIEMELAILADRCDITEEIVRMKSHLTQFAELLDSADAVGRKMDFLTQEMHRELNTMGSKSRDIDTSRLIIELKGELEKVREQVQNIE